MRRRKFCSFLALTAMAGVVLAATPAYATTEQALLASPVDGRVTSAPPHRGYEGDWAMDVGAGAGTAVYVRFGRATGSLSLNITRVGQSCSSGRQGGQMVTVEARVDGVLLGRTNYLHLANARGVGPLNNGDQIGTVAGGLPVNELCWTGPHVHIEPRNELKYSCHAGVGVGAVVGAGTVFGVFGGEWAGAVDTRCPADALNVGSEPSTGNLPFGHFDQAQSTDAGRVHVAGWAIDDDARTSPVAIHVYVGGEAGAAGAEGHDLGIANVSRPDVGAAHAGAGDQHGFATAFTTGKTGAQPVCVYAINIGGGHNPLLGCKTITIQNHEPFGSLDTANGGAGTLHVRGWAMDRNAGTAPVRVHVYVGGPAGTTGAEGHDIGAATTDRPDIGAAHPWAGSAHGFDTLIHTQKRGTQQVCGYAINVGPGENQLLGCRSTTIGEVPAQPSVEIERLAGADRLGTAAAISKETWPDQGAQSVVLARHDAFPDALAGTPLAVAKDGPLLLTPSTGLHAGVAAEIQRVLPAGRTVYLLGGPSALSQNIADAATRLGYKVARLGGADRYATAVTISKQLGTPSRIFEATGLSFQNALISGVAAASSGGVVVLTADGQMPAATRGYLHMHPGVERLAVGPQAGAADPGATKIAGTTVYETARLVAERFFSAPHAAAVASGTVFADALAGGAHVGRLGGPLLLSEPKRLPAPTAGYLGANEASIGTATLYGGPAALSASVEDAVRSNLRQ